MIRAILAAVVGYILMAVVVIVGLSVAFIVMGVDKVFEPGSYDITLLWGTVMIAISVVAAVLGGVVCMFIARRGSKAPVGLAALVLVLGGVSAVIALIAEDPGPRTEDVQTLEAASVAKQPVWTLIANPAIGAFGVILGAKLTGRCDKRGVQAASDSASA